MKIRNDTSKYKFIQSSINSEISDVEEDNKIVLSPENNVIKPVKRENENQSKNTEKSAKII